MKSLEKFISDDTDLFDTVIAGKEFDEKQQKKIL